jgi:hypothetical protein
VQKPLPAWAFGVLATVGAILVGSMVLSWVDIFGSTRGITLAWEENHWLFMVPIAGAALCAAAATRSPHTRLAAIFAGIVVSGYTLFQVATTFIHGGLDTWLMFGGAGLLLASTQPSRTPYRVVGGLAILAGFFAPWADYSLWSALRGSEVSMFSLGVRVLWLVPLAGLGGIISAGNSVTGGKIAAASGLAVFGAMLYVIGSVAWQVFGLGAWLALGASTLALLIGVLVRDAIPQIAGVKKSDDAAAA